MGILDDAIKEHLELKRQHGAADDELKKLEDEVFGASDRPGEPDSPSDPFAEAPTEFLSQPDLAEPPQGEEAVAGRRPRTEIADLQEPPPAPPGADAQAAEEEPPAEEEAPAIEQAIPEPAPQARPEPEEPTGPSTTEREAIAEQPTELYDVDEELGESAAPAPTEDELAEEELREPRLAPAEPLPEVVDADEEDDDFWDEKRLSDELDEALEGPGEDEDEEALYEDAATEGEEEEEEARPSSDEDDVLEETPEFLEEAPEDDRLWFEQKPPKDFDFDD
jgi:hypothetical protein